MPIAAFAGEIDTILPESEATAAPASAVSPWVTTIGDDFVNRCVMSPTDDLAKMVPDPSYILAYCSGSSTCSVPAPTHHGGQMVHRQGIQRLVRGGRNYLLVTASIEPGHGYQPGFETVLMGSRSGSGAALRSGGVTPSTPPNCTDHVASWNQTSSTAYDHAGGPQIFGRYMVVPFESSSDSATASFRVVDLDTPPAPVWGSNVRRTTGQTTNAGGAAMTRIADGRYLVMVFGVDASDVQVFVSTGTSMCMGTSCWSPKASVATGFRPYQSLQLITSCDGNFYIVGTHKDGDTDWADLWRVTFASATTFAPTFAKITNFHAFCSTSHTGDTRYCDFQGGAGAYISPTGHLYIYGVEHYDDAPPGDGTAVKVREFTQ